MHDFYSAARLRDSEARFRLLTQNFTDIVLSPDIGGSIRYASPSIKLLGRHEPGDLVGRAAVDLIVKDCGVMNAVRETSQRRLNEAALSRVI